MGISHAEQLSVAVELCAVSGGIPLWRIHQGMAVCSLIHSCYTVASQDDQQDNGKPFQGGLVTASVGECALMWCTVNVEG